MTRLDSRPDKMTPYEITSYEIASFVLAIFLFLPLTAFAQEELPRRWAEFNLDSGTVANLSNERAVTFSETVQVEGAPWIRLFFNKTELGGVDGREDGTILRITSLKDGAVQTHTAKTLQQWYSSSAFFNGDTVRVELLADPGAAPSRIAIHEVLVGLEAAPAQKSICGPLDDRTLSNDARNARIVPVGCTGWLIDDAQNCFLTAGHCIGSSLTVVEFNVPLSNADGSLNHPGPEDQYVIDQTSVQGTGSGIGNDWGYFGTFPNTQTGLTAAQAQGDTYVLGTPPTAPGGEMIRITGYGSTTGTQGTPLTWDQVQKTHVGALASVSGNALSYATDTTGGNSGSPVINEGNGTAIGIHTHAGCNAGGGANNGTSLIHPNLQSALANPLGVCLNGPPPLQIELAPEIPDLLPPADYEVAIRVTDRDGSPIAINSGTLIYNAGAGDVSVSFSAIEVSPATQGVDDAATHRATLPAQSCGTEVTWRIELEALDGYIVRFPFAPDPSADRRFRNWVSWLEDHLFHDDFETDMGWTIEDDPGLSAGSWERGVPAGWNGRQDPPWDADDSGQCFGTDHAIGNTDVDGGATRLISPPMNALLGDDPHVSYRRWWDDGGASDDQFTVDISNDGQNWVPLETLTAGQGGSAWVYRTFRVADFVDLTDQIRLRFTASDLGDGHIIEAGVDDVALYNNASGLNCDGGIFADGFESGTLALWSLIVL